MDRSHETFDDVMSEFTRLAAMESIHVVFQEDANNPFSNYLEISGYNNAAHSGNVVSLFKPGRITQEVHRLAATFDEDDAGYFITFPAMLSFLFQSAGLPTNCLKERISELDRSGWKTIGQPGW